MVEVASGREGKRGASLPRDSFLTVHIERGVAEERRDFQWAALAALMALKYAFLERLAFARLAGRWSVVHELARAESRPRLEPARLVAPLGSWARA